VRRGSSRASGARCWLFLEDHIDGSACQCIGLQRRRLVVRRDPRIADQTRQAVLDDLGIIPPKTGSWGFCAFGFASLGATAVAEDFLGQGATGSVCGEQLVEGSSAV
jgi:hypothetical protein